MNPPNDYQKKIISKMLSLEFPGVAELRKQADDFTVINYDDPHGFGSFGITTSARAPKATVSHSVPVEGVSWDVTGVPIEFLLHVVDGYMNELEIVVYSGIKQIDPIKLENIRVLTYEDKLKNRS